MAAVYKLFSPDLVYIRYLNLALGVLTCFLVYRVGERLGDRATGVLAALGLALYKPFILDSVVPLKTALFVTLFALSLWLLVLELETPRWGRALLLGIVAGLMLNVAGHALALLPVFGAAVVLAGPAGDREGRWARQARRAGIGLLAFGAGLLVVVAPVALRNHRVGGEWVLTTSQGGFNLYLGNRLDNPEPYYTPTAFASASPFEQGVQFTIEASRRVGRKLTPGEASRYWRNEVLRLAAGTPGKLAVKLGIKGMALLNGYERGDHYGVDFLGRYARFFALPLPGWTLLFSLGSAGLILAALTGKGRSRPVRWIVLASCAYAATLVLFFTNTRYRAPLAIPLILFAALGVQELLRAVAEKKPRRIAAYLGVTAGAAVLALIPIPGSGDQTAYINTHAVILDSLGRTAEAMQSWQESSQKGGTFSAFADLSLAGKFLAKRDFGLGLEALDRIAETSFAAAFKHELLGDVLVLRGDPRKAVAEYDRSIAINGGRTRPREKLIWLLGTHDPGRVQKEQTDLAFVRSFYP
jgi:4-amino-4-deoxy-L-arabinose transferase-like glycosyltransferase